MNQICVCLRRIIIWKVEPVGTATMIEEEEQQEAQKGIPEKEEEGSIDIPTTG